MKTFDFYEMKNEIHPNLFLYFIMIVANIVGIFMGILLILTTIFKLSVTT